MRNLEEKRKERRESQKLQSEAGYFWLTRGIACILAIAAGMKAWQLATVPNLGEGLLNARWFNILVVEFELAFAIWLLLGLLPGLTRFGAIVLFTIFGGVSLFKALSGEASCGCFGQAQVNPWLTATLDFVIVGTLLLSRRSVWRTSRTIPFKTIVVAVLLWATISAPLLYSFYSVEKNVLDGEKELLYSEKSITLEPKNWVGKDCPLFDAIYVNSDDEILPLKQGEWRLLLLHRDCSNCQNLVQLLADSENDIDFERLGIIEIPAGEPMEFPEAVKNRVGFIGSLRRGPRWFAPSPVLMDLKDGVVTVVQTNTAVVETFFHNFNG